MSKTIWINTNRYLYNIEIDGVSQQVVRDGRIDYRQTIASIKAKTGAKSVYITFLGRVTVI